MTVRAGDISSSARSAAPMARMQWWIRPGPSRAWLIAKPSPSPLSTSLAGTLTFSKMISAWPSRSAYPNTGRLRTTVTPGASIGTTIIDC